MTAARFACASHYLYNLGTKWEFLPFVNIIKGGIHMSLKFISLSVALAVLISTGAQAASADGGTTAMTRGEAVIALYRFHGDHDKGIPGGRFDDVVDGASYADAVNWAASRGIVRGYGGGRFAPDDYITRQDFAAMLEKYIKVNGLNFPMTMQYTMFADADEIAPYAKNAAQTAVVLGLLACENSGFDPSGIVSTEQAEAALNRLSQLVKKYLLSPRVLPFPN